MTRLPRITGQQVITALRKAGFQVFVSKVVTIFWPTRMSGIRLCSLDDFLAEEGMLAEAEAVAWKRVIAFQIAQLMQEQNVSKTEIARRMQTSRASVDRLLDPENESATLITLEKAALALGKRLQIALV